MLSPRVIDLQRAKRAISYLAGTANYHLIFHAEDEKEIYGWADSSFNSGEGNRRNRYGYCFQLGKKSGVFVAVCKRSTLVAQSLTEAEFYCLAETCREMLWIRSFLQEILEEILCRKIFQDNTSIINMVSHEGVSERSKHIDVKFHILMKLKSSGEAEFPHINSLEMCADDIR